MIISVEQVNIALLFPLSDRETGKITAIDPGVLQHISQKQEDLPRRKPSDSFVECVIPLGESSLTRERFITFSRGIRLGRLLESFDTFAGMHHLI